VWGVGAAGARVVATAVARDLFEGVEMARAMSQIMAVFVLVPVIAPTLGAGIVAILPWRAVFWACAIWAIARAAGTRRLPESLPPERRRRLDRSDIASAYAEFARTRATLWFSIASVFLQSVFTMYLASAELIVSEIFGRRSAFPMVFGVIAIGFGIAALVNGRVVGRFGVRPVMNTMLVSLIVGAVLLVAVTLAGGGTPSFWVFIPLLGLLLAQFMFLMPNMNAEALEPVPHIAGTASSLSGGLRMAGGAILGGIVAARIDTSLTPFAVAFLVFILLAAASTIVATRPPQRPS
ncbi:MAG: MFS transporter, partial [Ilumatobacter sp.]